MFYQEKEEGGYDEDVPGVSQKNVCLILYKYKT